MERERARHAAGVERIADQTAVVRAQERAVRPAREVQPVLELQIEVDVRVGLVDRAAAVDVAVGRQEQVGALDPAVRRERPVQVEEGLRTADVAVHREAQHRRVLGADRPVPGVDLVVVLVDVDEVFALVRQPVVLDEAAVLARVVERVHEAGVVVAPADLRLPGGVVAGARVDGVVAEPMVRGDGVDRPRERAVRRRVLVAEHHVVEPGALRFHEPERLQALRAFELEAAVERADRRRVEDHVRRRVDPGERDRVEEVGALGEERPVLVQRAPELLRRDRLLVDLDVGVVRCERRDERGGAGDRHDDVGAEVARTGVDEVAVGLLEAAAVHPRAAERVDLRARRPARRAAGDLQPGEARPEARVARLRETVRAPAAVAHRRVVRPRLVHVERGDAADEVEAPGLHRAARAPQHLQRDDHHRAPLVARDARDGGPRGRETRGLRRLLVARPAGRRHEEVDLSAVPGRVDPDPGEVVQAEPDVVRSLRGGHGRAGLVQLHPDVQVLIVVEQHEARLERARPLRRDRLQLARDDGLVPGRIAQRGVERRRLVRARRREASGRARDGRRGQRHHAERCANPRRQNQTSQSHAHSYRRHLRIVS